MGFPLAALVGWMLIMANGTDAPRPDRTHPLGFPDGMFAPGHPLPEERILARAESLGVTGLLVDGPRRAPAGESLPLLGAFVRTLREDLVLRLEDAVLLVWDAGADRLSAHPGFPSAKKPAGDGPPAGFDPGEGRVASAFSVAARAGEDRWSPGRYTLWLMLGEYVSNPVSVLVGDATGTSAPAEPASGGVLRLLASKAHHVDLVLGARAGGGPVSVQLGFQRRGSRSLRIWREEIPVSGGEARVSLRLPGDATGGVLIAVVEGTLGGPLAIPGP